VESITFEGDGLKPSRFTDEGTRRPMSAASRDQGKIFGDRRERPVRLEIREADGGEIAAPTNQAPFGLVTAAITIREGLVMASSRSRSLSLASVNNPCSRTTSAIVRPSSSARRAMREHAS
jgi:hypothetical protein